MQRPHPAPALEDGADAVPAAVGAAASESSANESGFGNSWPSSRSHVVLTASDFARGDLMAYAIRMVTPLRREFGRALDVTHFLYKAEYAKEIIALALTSKDARLRAYATFLQLEMFAQPSPRRR